MQTAALQKFEIVSPVLTAILPLESYVDRFLAEKDVRQNSKALYRRTLKQYFTWVKKKGYLLSEITRAEIIEFKEELLASGKSPLTCGSYINSLRQFYEFIEGERLGPNISKGVKAPRRINQFKKEALSIAQTKILLEHCQDETLRNFAVINLLLRTGLRVCEVVRANVGDIAYKSTEMGARRILKVHGKGRDSTDSFVLLTDKAFQPIEKYLATRKNAKEIDPLFVSTSNNSRGERLTTRTISLIAKNGLKSIGLDHRSFSAHSLRHTTAVNMLRAGAPDKDVQFALRHADPATTQIYTATLDEERRLANSGAALLDTLF